MEMRRDISGQVEISVELSSFLKRFTVPASDDEKSFESSLRDYLKELTMNLAIPGEISLRIGLFPGDSETNSFAVTINGQRCRLPLPTEVKQNATPRELAKLVAAGVYQNRELCLTASQSEQVLNQWLSDSGRAVTDSGIVPAEFHQCLLELLRRGFGINRVENLLAESNKQAPTGDGANTELSDRIRESNDVAIKVFLGKKQFASVQNPARDGDVAADDQSIHELFSLMQDGLFYELGLVLPDVVLEADDSLEDNEFQFQVNDLRLLPVAGLEQNQILVNETVERLSLLNVTGDKAANPANRTESAIVRTGKGATEICRNAGLTTWGSAGFIVLSLSETIRKNAGNLLTTEVVEFMMNQLGQSFPALLSNTEARFSLVKLARVLRDLLDEEISIRDLREILEGLLSINGATTTDLSKYIVFFPYTLNLCLLRGGGTAENLNSSDYSNCVRTFMKRYISHKYSRGNNTLPVYLIHPEIEARINEIDKQPLKTEEHDKLIRSVTNEVQYSPTNTPVILTSIEGRKLLRNLIEKEFPWLAVLSYQELAPEMNIQPLARIEWS